ncbi:unnamed protein product [Rangifer tarandus platyrhynchus]|uniref:Uncharacterized protein n=2 Tax=Rangifer tarandus platyrhynchus TaxID=3082113 RepID=A0ABN8YSU4_RANTA|nr:unnamed protein product [Rangifer tarandus platyrhynchus]CAI9702253.1 unnamed protein product [Rangifer tarandus platyrhynchus]
MGAGSRRQAGSGPEQQQQQQKEKLVLMQTVQNQPVGLRGFNLGIKPCQQRQTAAQSVNSTTGQDIGSLGSKASGCARGTRPPGLGHFLPCTGGDAALQAKSSGCRPGLPGPHLLYHIETLWPQASHPSHLRWFLPKAPLWGGRMDGERKRQHEAPHPRKQQSSYHQSLFVMTVVTWMYLLQLSRKSRLTLIDIVTYLENYLFINGS